MHVPTMHRVPKGSSSSDGKPADMGRAAVGWPSRRQLPRYTAKKSKNCWPSVCRCRNWRADTTRADPLSPASGMEQPVNESESVAATANTARASHRVTDTSVPRSVGSVDEDRATPVRDRIPTPAKLADSLDRSTRSGHPFTLDRRRSFRFDGGLLVRRRVHEVHARHALGGRFQTGNGSADGGAKQQARQAAHIKAPASSRRLHRPTPLLAQSRRVRGANSSPNAIQRPAKCGLCHIWRTNEIRCEPTQQR